MSANCHKLDKVQNRAVRFYCGIPRKAPILSYSGDMGWIPNIVNRDLELVRMFNNICKMGPERLPRKVMEMDAEMSGDWSKSVESLLSSIDRSANWTERLPVNVDHARIELMKMHEEVWLNGISEKPKLCTYVKVKKQYETEPYLRAMLLKHKRSLISRLRTGTLSLQIELGRFAKIPREQRICNLCKSDVEDEVHFMFNCPELADVRQPFYEKVSELRVCENDIKRFKTLDSMPFMFGDFITKMWDERNKRLYVCAR